MQHINAYEKQKEFIKKQEDFIAKNKARYSTTGLVCHEPSFYEDWVTKVWDVEEWAENNA
ncbi:hypothetical protein [Sutcliffiella halmapala]|uniref:hypothetical protein n=1 Tax=Sutcliffiella halmapala TaxID=79882 RepID=UPI0011173BC1|nr:hypothetical protein [Sutcliffiella halmapala]